MTDSKCSKWVVLLQQPDGSEWYLRGTIFTGDSSRASVYATVVDAHKAIEQAAKFTRKSAIKRVQIVKVIA